LKFQADTYDYLAVPPSATQKYICLCATCLCCACMFVSKQRTVPSCFPNCSAYSGWPRTAPPSLACPHVSDCLLSVSLLFVSVLFLSLYMHLLFLKFLASQVSVCSLRACFRKVKYHTVSVFLSLQQETMAVSASVSL
jgi:hypothetical protein